MSVLMVQLSLYIYTLYIFPWILFTALDFCPAKHRLVVPWASPFFIKQSACWLFSTAFHMQNIFRLNQLSDTANSLSPSFLWNLRCSMYVILEWVKVSHSLFLMFLTSIPGQEKLSISTCLWHRSLLTSRH